jgi:hypothetical protein
MTSCRWWSSASDDDFSGELVEDAVQDPVLHRYQGRHGCLRCTDGCDGCGTDGDDLGCGDAELDEDLALHGDDSVGSQIHAAGHQVTSLDQALHVAVALARPGSRQRGIRLALVLLPEVGNLPAMSSEGSRRMVGVLAQMASGLNQLVLVDLGPQETQEIDDLGEPVRQIDGYSRLPVSQR